MVLSYMMVWHYLLPPIWHGPCLPLQQPSIAGSAGEMNHMSRKLKRRLAINAQTELAASDEVLSALAPAPLFSMALLSWAKSHGRHDLPWQQPRTAYRVWVSEVMLQQTQVATVIGYFKRFMRVFPSLKALAAAPLDAVLGQWAGLGYYRRAHYMHAAALQIMQQHKGRFPRDLAALMALPGIGRSTAGAILSLGMGKTAVILDANVKRVLARYYALPTPLPKAAAYRHLWQLATWQTPAQRVADYNQAMMDLGALVCTAKQPACSQCPLATDCRAFAKSEVLLYPRKVVKKLKTEKKSRRREQKMLVMLDLGLGVAGWQQYITDHLATDTSLTLQQRKIIKEIQSHLAAKDQLAVPAHANKVLSMQGDLQILHLLLQYTSIYLQKRPAYGIWSGLYSFPMCAMEDDEVQLASLQLGFKVYAKLELAVIKHVFSHFDLYASPQVLLGQAQPAVAETDALWCANPSVDVPGGMPALVQKFLDSASS